MAMMSKKLLVTMNAAALAWLAMFTSKCDAFSPLFQSRATSAPSLTQEWRSGASALYFKADDAAASVSIASSSVETAKLTKPRKRSRDKRPSQKRQADISIVKNVSNVPRTTIHSIALAATGAWIRQALRALLSPIPTSVRYFLQPFMILYFAPLYALKAMTAPPRQQAPRHHEVYVSNWEEDIANTNARPDYWYGVLNQSESVRYDVI
jgi:hypothetical protein